MRVVQLGGSPRAMGRAFGDACRADVVELWHRRADNATEQARRFGGRVLDREVLLGLARRSLPAMRAHDPAGFEELEGIAEGAGLGLEEVVACNGLTDFRDALAWAPPSELEGCSSFVAQRDATADGRILCGQTWDLATDNMPFVLVVARTPDGGPRTWSLTTAGCLSLIGMNEAGIAVGTTNLRTTDARAGVPYLSLVHRALGQTDFEAAIAAIVDAPRAGAHFYYVVDGPGGRAAAIECAATFHRRTDLAAGSRVQCNHALDPDLTAIEAPTPRASSLARQARLEALLARHHGRLDRDLAQGFFADREGDALAICRHDTDGISSNGAVVMVPEAPSMRVVHGPADENRWTELLEVGP